MLGPPETAHAVIATPHSMHFCSSDSGQRGFLGWEMSSTMGELYNETDLSKLLFGTGVGITIMTSVPRGTQES